MNLATGNHLDILRQGVAVWNRWREANPQIQPNLDGASLFGIVGRDRDGGRQQSLKKGFRTPLDGINLSGASLTRAFLESVDMRNADLSGANLLAANLRRADLSGATLEGADLYEADLYQANLSSARLMGARLVRARLVDVSLARADIENCTIYGISAWNVDLTDARQWNLQITDPARTWEAPIVVDDLEIAQFIHLLLSRQRIRAVIDAITSKTVLILGSFSPERKRILDAIRSSLRSHGLVPILFDFEKPQSRDLTETVSLLAHMARFVIADLTEPRSIPQELQRIAPDLAVPIQPILLKGNTPYGMFADFQKYDWVLKVYEYGDENQLIESLDEKVIGPAEDRLRRGTHAAPDADRALIQQLQAEVARLRTVIDRRG